MIEKVQFVDFGVPESFGTHVFRIEISAARTEPVRLIEDFGYRGLDGGIPRYEERVILSRTVWSGIAEMARLTVAEAGLPEDTQRGWRRALFHALSDGEKLPVHSKRRRPADTDLCNLPLFEAIA